MIKDNIKMFKSHIVIICIFLLVLTSCSPDTTLTETEAVNIPSPSPTETATPTSSATPIPILSTSTNQPISGLALWQLNVRSGPGIQYTLLGKINQGENVQINGQDPTGEWLMIVYDDPSGQAWVTAEYVQYTSAGNLPIVGSITLSNGTPAPQGTLSEKINVREGPGTQYESLGILPANATIWIIGRNLDGSWLLINYPSAPDGKGWVISGYVIVQDIMGLPAMDSAGTLIHKTPGVPPEIAAFTPTAELSIATNDDDSFEKPAISIVFSPIGTEKIRYTSDLSQPNGDRTDWVKVQFQGSNQSDMVSITASLFCSGNGSIVVQLFKDLQKADNWGELSCGDKDQLIKISAGIQYIFQFEIVGQASSSYIFYTIDMDMIQ